MSDDAAAVAAPAAATPTTEGDPTANVPIPGVNAPEGGASEAPPPEAAPSSPAAKPANESALAKAIRRREATLVQEQQRFRAQMEAQERAVADRVAAEVEKRVNERFKDFDDDPIGFSEKRGKTKQQLAELLLHDGKKPPEEIAREASERAERLEKQIAERELAAKRTEAERVFVAHMKANDARFPHLLDEWTEGEVVEKTYALLARLDAKFDAEGKRRPYVSDDSILEYLDAQAKRRQSERQERQKARQGASGATAAGAATKVAGSVGAAPEGVKAEATATTLNGRVGAERQTIGAKDALEIELEKGADEARDYVLREVEKARNASAAAR